MEEKIIEFLSGEDKPVRTIEIARHIIGVGTPRKVVNPTLYKLLSQKKVLKTANPDGTNPHWQLVKESD